VVSGKDPVWRTARLFLLLLPACLLSACGPARPTPAPSAPPVPAATAPPSSTPAPSPAATTRPVSTPTPTSTPLPTGTSTPVPTAAPTAAPACLLPSQEAIDPAQTLAGLVFYVAPGSGTNPGALLAPDRGASRFPTEQLWAISPDGRRAGPLTADRAGIGYFVSPAGLLVLSAQTLPLAAGPVRQVPLPAACDRPADLPAGADWFPCSDFRLSADGRWAAFLQGEDICGRGLVLLNLETGESQLLPRGHGTWLFQFLPSGRLLLTRGHCEGAGTYLRDPATGEETGLGSWGQEFWSPDGTALAVRASAYMGWESWVWGFDLGTERRFLAPAAILAVDDLPLWTPDGTHLLYQHRALTYTQSAWPITVTLGPREVRLVDVLQGEERVLLGDPAHDYHLGRGLNDAPWYGPDWLPLRRVPYRPQSYPGVEEADFSAPAIRCLLYGVDCPDPAEELVLNWRTGEVVPAGRFVPPTALPLAVPTPTPTPSPDLGRGPLYADPAGRYRLYVGAGGTGLWCVPAAGLPVRWIEGGHDFVYIP